MDTAQLQTYVDRCLRGLRGLEIDRGVYLASPADGPYPHIYSRDQAFVCKALDDASLFGEAEDALRFLCRAQERNGGWHQRYSPQGEAFCNRPGQVDCTGIVLHALCHHAQATGSRAFSEEIWPVVEGGVDFILARLSEGLVYSYHSLHEAPVEEGFEVWANSWCWRGMRDSALLAEKLGRRQEAREWSASASRLEASVRSRFWDPALGYFRKVLSPLPDADAIDISGMAPLWTGMVSPAEETGAMQLRSAYTLLWHPDIGGFLRYHRFGLIKAWHWYDGGNGSWLFYTAFMASAFLRAGDADRARECLDWCLKQFLPGDALPEHVSTPEEFNVWKSQDPDALTLFKTPLARAEANVYSFEHQGRTCRVVPWIFPLAWAQAQVMAALLDYAGYMGVSVSPTHGDAR